MAFRDPCEVRKPVASVLAGTVTRTAGGPPGHCSPPLAFPAQALVGGQQAGGDRRSRSPRS